MIIDKKTPMQIENIFTVMTKAMVSGNPKTKKKPPKKS